MVALKVLVGQAAVYGLRFQARRELVRSDVDQQLQATRKLLTSSV